MKKNRDLLIHFDNADDADELYFNGTLVGSTGSIPPHYVSKYGVKRKYIVPSGLVKVGEKNLIAIRVFDGGGGGGIISERFTIQPGSDVNKIVLSASIDDEDWVFEGQPDVNLGIAVKSQLSRTSKVDLKLKITTDDYQPICELSEFVKTRPDENRLVPFKIELPDPGFYHCTAWAEKDGIKGEEINFNIGYEPEKIVSPVDAQPDFEEFEHCGYILGGRVRAL